MKKSEIKIRFQEYIATNYTSEATLKTYDNIEIDINPINELIMHVK